MTRANPFDLKTVRGQTSHFGFLKETDLVLDANSEPTHWEVISFTPKKNIHEDLDTDKVQEKSHSLRKFYF